MDIVHEPESVFYIFYAGISKIWLWLELDTN